MAELLRSKAYRNWVIIETHGFSGYDMIGT